MNDHLRPLAAYEPDTTGRPTRTVTVDLDVEQDAHFVLTQALEDFADRQRHQAEHDPGSAEDRRDWAATADRLRDRIESAR